MLAYDDPRWKHLNGGYGKPYDPTAALSALESGANIQEAWAELWQELHHQGDIGEASYAAVPHLVRIHRHSGNLDWNLYALMSTIEVERHRRSNPVLPDWLEPSYRDAWETLLDLALADLKKSEDQLTVRAILGAIALCKGLIKFGALISSFDESEITEYLDEYLAWSEQYR